MFASASPPKFVPELYAYALCSELRRKLSLRKTSAQVGNSMSHWQSRLTRQNLTLSSGPGSAHAFAVAAALAAAPPACSGFGCVVEKPPAIVVPAEFDACGFSAAKRVREAAHNLGHDPIPAGCFRHKFNPQSILALYHLLFTRYVQNFI